MTGRVQPIAALLSIALGLVSASPARADFSVQLHLEHPTVARMETVRAFVTVSNQSSAAAVVSSQNVKDSARLDFEVRSVASGTTLKRAGGELIGTTVLEPGEGHRFLVDLSQFYPLQANGGYSARAFVTYQGVRFSTPPMTFDVVNGLPVSSIVRASPGGKGAVRTYTLSYLAREQSEVLFLSISETPTGLSFGVFPLGPLVRVFTPVLEIDSSGRITVVHQSGPKQYTRSLLQSTEDGVRLVDQSYEKLGGHIRMDGRWEEAPVKDQAPATER